MSGRRCRLTTDDDKDLDPNRDELDSEGVEAYGCHPERTAEYDARLAVLGLG